MTIFQLLANRMLLQRFFGQLYQLQAETLMYNCNGVNNSNIMIAFNSHSLITQSHFYLFINLFFLAIKYFSYPHPIQCIKLLLATFSFHFTQMPDDQIISNGKDVS